MMTLYVVSQGDFLSSITKSFGFTDWQTIYNDPLNVSLEKKRPNPNVIYSGDVLFIPDKKVKEESKPTDAHHKFQKHGHANRQ